MTKTAPKNEEEASIPAKQTFNIDGEGIYENMTVEAVDLAEAQAIWEANRVLIPDKVMHFYCEVCGTKTGDLTFPPFDPRDIESMVPADFGYTNIRCGKHPLGVDPDATDAIET